MSKIIGVLVFILLFFCFFVSTNHVHAREPDNPVGKEGVKDPATEKVAPPKAVDRVQPQGEGSAPNKTPAEVTPPEKKPAEIIGTEGLSIGDNPSKGSPSERTSVTGVPGPGSSMPVNVEAQTDSVGKDKSFMKGELVYPGTRRLLSRFDHVGVAFGASIIDSDVWATVTPGMAWYFDCGLAMSFNLPLRLLAVDLVGKDVAYGGLKVRRQDWDDVADFAKIIRFITIGRKESKIYASINTMRPTTIGHGIIMNNYQGDIDVDRSLTGLIFDAYNNYGGLQFQLNDITLQNGIVGALAFVKPLSFFFDDVLSRSLSVGLEYIIDTKAPRCILKEVGSTECVQGIGHEPGFDSSTDASLDGSFVRTDPDSGRFAVLESSVQAIGGSIEYKFLKDDVNDIKVYSTLHSFLNDGGGTGLALGVLARINIGDKWISAFRLRGEYRSFSDGFIPAYFNTLYEIQKFGYLPKRKSYQVTPTKYQQVFGDPANGFKRDDRGWRHGINLDLSWGLFKNKRTAKQLAVGIGLQESSGPYDTCFYAHIEFPFLEWLQVFATYMRMDVEGLDKLFSRHQDAIILTGFRLQVLPIMFINGHYSQNYRIVASPGTELHLGNDRIVDASGLPSADFVQSDLYQNVHTFFLEVEFGWEFSDSY